MTKVVVIGLGPIGAACARAVSAEADMELVGLVDIDPAKQGKSLADLEEMSDQPGDVEVAADADTKRPRVVPNIDKALEGKSADVALVTATSRFERIAPMLGELVSHGLCVVSSCEEMAWPWYRYPGLADEVNQKAVAAGRTVLGTGVNPGFVMDSFAVMASSVVRRVAALKCTRRVDAGLRRIPLQAKVGATLTQSEFNAKAKAGQLGHVGIAESLAMLAAGLGHKVTPGSVKIVLEPVIADHSLNSGLGLIEPGEVAGIHNTASWSDDTLAIDLDLTMAVGLTDPKDLIEITGPVSIRIKVPGGLPGDSATVAVLVNYARTITSARPGLRTMIDIPPAGCRGRDE